MSGAFMCFAFIGVKRKKAKNNNKNIRDELKNTQMPVIEMTKAEKEAYFNAGMPGPPEQWLVKHREHENAN